MSSLKHIEKNSFESLLEMNSGYVLDFNEASYLAFFKEHYININDPKYGQESKAKRLRKFWEIESDKITSNVLQDLIQIWLDRQSNQTEAKNTLDFIKAQQAINRLLGKTCFSYVETNESEFLNKKFKTTSLSKLNLEPSLLPILENRIRDSQKCLSNELYLPCIILIGSVLEGILLGVANHCPSEFNKAPNVPKNKNSGKPLLFHEWKLSQLIDVAYEIGLIKLDVKKFSHSIRDFRNYIHPYEHMTAKFHPDKHTATICFQVLLAAIADLGKER